MGSLHVAAPAVDRVLLLAHPLSLGQTLCLNHHPTQRQTQARTHKLRHTHQLTMIMSTPRARASARAALVGITPSGVLSSASTRTSGALQAARGARQQRVGDS